MEFHLDPPESLFCLNAECENHLTKKEIEKMHPTRISKWWFCAKCRLISRHHKIFINCFECDKKFLHLNNQKYCDVCVKDDKYKRTKNFHCSRNSFNKKSIEVLKC